MNILAYWKTDIEHLRELKEKYKASIVFLLCDSGMNNMYDEEWIFPIMIEEPIDSLLSLIDSRIPLDEKLLEKLQKFETTSMEIINRWRRSIVTKESYLSIKNALYKYYLFWLNIFMSKEIGVFVLFAEPHIPMTYIPYAICQAFNIPTIILGLLPVIDQKKLNYLFESSLDNYDGEFDKRYSKLQLQYEHNDEQISLDDNLDYYFTMYGKENKKVERVTTYNERDSLLSKLRFYASRAKVYTSQGRYNVLRNKIKYYIKANTDAKPLLKYVETLEEQPKEEKFLVFFLHLQPESTTLPKGGVFVDQLLVIDMISKCLPADVFLYVKEHPAYWELTERRESIYESRSREFYDRISRSRNVRLIDHKYSSLELMDRCIGAVNITGTAGFEAMFKCIPNIVFGYASYSKYKYSYNIRNYEECKKAIDEIISHPRVGTLRDVRIFLKALEPDVIAYGCDEKSYQDNGVPAPSIEDFNNFLNKLVWFYDHTYKIGSTN